MKCIISTNLILKKHKSSNSNLPLCKHSEFNLLLTEEYILERTVRMLSCFYWAEWSIWTYLVSKTEFNFGTKWGRGLPPTHSGAHIYPWKFFCRKERGGRVEAGRKQREWEGNEGESPKLYSPEVQYAASSKAVQSSGTWSASSVPYSGSTPIPLLCHLYFYPPPK